jgi:hypothetical protein
LRLQWRFFPLLLLLTLTLRRRRRRWLLLHRRWRWLRLRRQLSSSSSSVDRRVDLLLRLLRRLLLPQQPQWRRLQLLLRLLLALRRLLLVRRLRILSSSSSRVVRGGRLRALGAAADRPPRAVDDAVCEVARRRQGLALRLGDCPKGLFHHPEALLRADELGAQRGGVRVHLGERAVEAAERFGVGAFARAHFRFEPAPLLVAPPEPVLLAHPRSVAQRVLVLGLLHPAPRARAAPLESVKFPNWRFQ